MQLNVQITITSFKQPGAAEQSWLTCLILVFPPAFPFFSGWFAIGPLGPFSKHIAFICCCPLPTLFLNFSGSDTDWWITPIILA